MHVNNQGDMNKSKIFGSNTELELAHGFDERRRFDVADRPSKLDEALATYGSGSVTADLREGSAPLQCRRPAPLQFHPLEFWRPAPPSLV